MLSKQGRKESRVCIFEIIHMQKGYISQEIVVIFKHSLKGMVMQIEKALINDRLRVSKVS